MERLKLNIQLFASNSATNTGLRSSASTPNKATLKVSFNEGDTPDSSKNTTTISISGSITMDRGSYSGVSSAYIAILWYDEVLGTETEIERKTVSSLSSGATSKIEGTYTATHKADGSLKGYAKAIWHYTGSGQYCPKSGEVKTDLTTLTQIPRKTTCPSVTGNIGEVSTININPASNTFRHTLQYILSDGTTGTIGTAKTDLVSISWTIPTSFYTKIGTTGTSISGTLRLTTYSNDVSIGTSDATFTANVKEDLAKLQITNVSIADVNNTTKTLTGNQSKIVANASTERITFSVTSKSNSTIKSLSINGVSIATNSTLYDIPKPTSKNVEIIAVDSRNFTTRYTTTIADSNWIAYTPLTISASAIRPDAISGKATLSGSGKYWNGNFGATSNTLTVRYRYKLKTDTSYTGWINLSTTYSSPNYTITPTTTGGIFNVNYAYDIEFSAVDKVNTSGTSTTISLNKALPIVWWNSTTFNVNGTINSTSLESRKKDIQDFDGALETVLESDIRMFSYNWEEEGQQHLGFIIADKGGNYKTPNIVINENGDGIELYTMCALLWKAVQEQQKIINEMRNEK